MIRRTYLLRICNIITRTSQRPSSYPLPVVVPSCEFCAWKTGDRHRKSCHTTYIMLRRTLPPLTRNKPCILPSILHCHRILSTSPYLRQGDPLPSVFEGVSAPLEVTTVLRTGKGFKIRTIQDPENPRTIHGNLFILHGDYFLWRPTLQFPSPNTLDIAPESWGILDVITPKPGKANCMSSWLGRITGTGDGK